jgi:hypothetical protein
MAYLGTKPANQVIDSTLIADGTVTTSDLANGAVSPAKLDINAQYTGFKNRIINGDCRIDQRNAGTAVTLPSGGIYTVDRWQGFEDTDGAMTAQQSSVAPAGFTNSLLFTTTTADASLGATQFACILQRIEGFNVSDLGWGTANAQPVTLSFWTRSSLTGTFGGSVRNGASDRSYGFSYTISAANTWEYKTITVAGDTSGTWLTTNGIGMFITWGLGVGSTYSGAANSWSSSVSQLTVTGATSVIGTLGATWQITGVQLEKGSTATSFDYRPYTTELQLCQRYAFKTNSDDYIGQAFAGTVAGVVFPYPVVMRAAPTSTLITNGSLVGSGGGGLAITGISATNNGTTTGRVNFTVSSGLVGGNATLVILSTVLFSSEL